MPKNDSAQLVDTTMILPNEEADSIYDAEAPNEVLNNPDSIEMGINNSALHAREVFMVRCPQSPLNPPEAPDVRS
jgi:hypothetical protein